MKFKPRFYYKLLKESANEFIEDNVMRLCASLAYYTIFALGPLLLVIISVTGIFFEKKRVTSEIAYQLQSFLGPQNAKQVIDIIQNMQHQNTAMRYSIIGVVILIIGATGVFAEIQDAINYIWSIKAKPKRGWLKFLKNRLLSFSLVVGIGFLMIVSLLIDTIADALTNSLQAKFEHVAVIFFKGFNVAFLYAVSTTLFAVIYKVLPDAEIKWKDAFVGASFTGALFLLGKFLISFYIGSSSIGITYGAAASIIVILSWVYYSAIILYFGAEFTKVYSISMGRQIRPHENAVFIVKGEEKEINKMPREMVEKATVVDDEEEENNQ